MFYTYVGACIKLRCTLRRTGGSEFVEKHDTWTCIYNNIYIMLIMFIPTLMNRMCVYAFQIFLIFLDQKSLLTQVDHRL